MKNRCASITPGLRKVTCTRRDILIKLPHNAMCAEFMGPYRGRLGMAPPGILAFVWTKHPWHLWTVAT